MAIIIPFNLTKSTLLTDNETNRQVIIKKMY